jgi:hypothetical protein
MEIIELGPVPSDENCAQLGVTENYSAVALAECRRYKRQLERMFPVPEGVEASFAVKSNRHEFGSYPEVALKFEGTVAGWDFSTHVENNLPDKWDDQDAAEQIDADTNKMIRALLGNGTLTAAQADSVREASTTSKQARERAAYVLDLARKAQVPA